MVVSVRLLAVPKVRKEGERGGEGVRTMASAEELSPLALLKSVVCGLYLVDTWFWTL